MVSVAPFCSATKMILFSDQESDVYITNVPVVAIFQRIYRCQDLDAAAYEIPGSIKGPSPIFRPFFTVYSGGLIC